MEGGSSLRMPDEHADMLDADADDPDGAHNEYLLRFARVPFLSFLASEMSARHLPVGRREKDLQTLLSCVFDGLSATPFVDH